MIIYNDFLINFDLGFDEAFKCRSNMDFEMSAQGDIQMTKSAIQVVLQKLWIWMAIKEGEVPNDPTLGCAIYKYFFKKSTPNNLALMQREVEYQLKTLIPELDVKSVTCVGANSSEGRIEDVHLEIISNTYGTYNLKTTQGDMEQLNEYYNQLNNALTLIEQNNK
jgi:hypothetical protein